MTQTPSIPQEAVPAQGGGAPPSSSSRARHLARMRKKNPEASFADDDDEAIYSQIEKDYDDYDSRISEYQGHEKEFADMYFSDPRAAAVMQEWRQGGDPLEAFIRVCGEEALDAYGDPAKMEAFRKANKEHAAKVAKSRQLDREWEENIVPSLELLKQVAEQDGVGDDKVDEAMALYAKMVADFERGVFTEEAIRMMLRAISYDSDIDAARAEGEVAGRNARIEERLRAREPQDDTAPLSGAGGAEPQPRRSQKDIFDLAGEA